MGESTQAIKHDIDEQRHQLEGNLHGIEEKLKDTAGQVTDKVEQVQEKVKNATDWRHQFDERPILGVGLAFGGGVLLASMLGGGGSRSSSGSSYQPQYQSSSYQGYGNGGHSGTDVGRQHVASTFDNIKGALMGVAAAQAKTFLEGALPGFNDEYRQVEKETDSSSKSKSGSTSQSASYPVQGSSQRTPADGGTS